MMSLSKAFEPAVLADQYFAEIDAANAGAAFGAVFDTNRDIAGPEFADSAMDMLVGRRQQGAAMAQPVMGDRGAPDQKISRGIKDKVTEAAAKIEEARGMQGDTVKLRTGKMTAASGSGAKAVGDYAQAKGAAADTALKAVNALREDMKAAKAEIKGGNNAAPSSAMGGMGRSAAGTSIVAQAARLVFPSAGTSVNMAGYGSFSPDRSFRSSLDNAGYGAGAGYATVDVMGGGAAAPVSSAMGQAMAQGPGFGRFDLDAYDENAASLESIEKLLLSEEGLQDIEADLREMKADADLGKTAHERWMNTNMTVAEAATGVPVAEAATGVPVAHLDINEMQQAALLSDNPALKDMTFKAPTSFSPRALG